MTRINIITAGLGLLLAGIASAGPVNFTFSQAGWSTGSLSGSFSGTPESNGVINMADLTSFSAIFTDANRQPADTFLFSQANLEGFSFNTADPFSLEFAAGFTPASIVLCSGPAETTNVCGVPVPPPPPPGGANVTTDGFFVDVPLFGPFKSSDAAQVSAGTVATPEPGTAPLVAGIAGFLMLVGGVRKRFFEGRRK